MTPPAPSEVPLTSSLAPICLFVYGRLEETRRTVQALQANFLAPESDLHIFSDGPKPGAEAKVEAVRAFIREIDGFKTVTLHASPENRGLARSVISGVTQVLGQSGKVIVLEDDILTSKNFLSFMNQSLDFYETAPRIFAVSGYAYPMKSLRNLEYDCTFGYRSYSWGWATWKDRWELVDWDVCDYAAFSSDRRNRRLFNKGGSDLWAMLRKQQQGKIDSWMIRWVYTQHKHHLLDVYPKISKTANIGFSAEATHTDCSDRRYRTQLDSGQQARFRFDPTCRIQENIQNEWEWMHSYIRRLFYKIINLTTK